MYKFAKTKKTQACYIASLSMSSLCLEWISNRQLVHSIEENNGRIQPTEVITIETVTHTPVHHKDYFINNNYTAENTRMHEYNHS